MRKSDLRAVFTAIDLSRTIVRRIYLNLSWALIYNIFSIPLAAGVLLPFTHTAVPPYIAGLAMALSSVSVLASSLQLYCYRKPNPSQIGTSNNNQMEKDFEMEKINSKSGDTISDINLNLPSNHNYNSSNLLFGQPSPSSETASDTENERTGLLSSGKTNRGQGPERQYGSINV